MIAEERHLFILNHLKKNGIVRSADLSKRLNISSETIRKDLELLGEKKLLKRVHGGAKLTNSAMDNEALGNYVSYDYRKNQRMNEKCYIAHQAAEMVSENQCIGLDSGTTTLEIAKVLKEKFQNLTIVTNSLVTVMELASCKGFEIICTGGVLRHDEYSFVTDLATAILSKINIDIMFITATGISAQSGVTDQRIDESSVHTQMANVARQIIVVADSSKINATSLVKVCDIDKVDFIITDDDLTTEGLKKSGISKEKIIICSKYNQ